MPLSFSELCPGSGWCCSELSHWHSAACLGGQRQVLSAWVAMGCHSWLVLGFPRAKPRARGAEGKHHDHVHAGPSHSCGTVTACWVAHTHFLVNLCACLSPRLRARSGILPRLLPSEEPSQLHASPVGSTGRGRTGSPVAPISAAPGVGAQPRCARSVKARAAASLQRDSGDAGPSLDSTTGSLCPRASPFLPLGPVQRPWGSLRPPFLSSFTGYDSGLRA